MRTRSIFDGFLAGHRGVAPAVLDRVLLGVERCASDGRQLPPSKKIAYSIGRSEHVVKDAFRVLERAGFIAAIERSRRQTGTRVVVLHDGRRTA